MAISKCNALASGRLTGCRNPTDFFLRYNDALVGCKALVRDRGSQFTAAFDEIFLAEGINVLKTPVRTPVANGFAERWIGTLRHELLDRTLIWNRPQLERIAIDFIDHYNEHRPHRSLDQHPPSRVDATAVGPPDDALGQSRTSRCDGLIHEYRNAS